VAAAAVAAGLAGWALAGLPGGTAARGHPSAPPATSPAPHTRPATPTVQVNGAALTGHRAWIVARQLRRLGLRVQVRFTRAGSQPPGTVVSVQPSGRVPAGSSVVVIAALAPRGHRGHGHGGPGHGGHGHGHGHGHGGGNGQGD
jgi:hypothetical protein